MPDFTLVLTRPGGLCQWWRIVSDQPPEPPVRRKLVLPPQPKTNGKEHVVEVKMGTQKIEVRASARATGEGAALEVMPSNLGNMAADIWRQGFLATEGRWDATQQCFIDIPDTKLRLETLRLFLAYAHGLPVQRQVRVQGGFIDHHEEKLSLARSDHGRKMLLAMGVIDENWVRKYLPSGDNPGDNPPIAA
jgi:hypothetical protein